MSYNYNSTDLVRPTELTEREQFLLKDSKTFCIYPWIHIHAYPTGEAYPCCQAEMKPGVVGNCRTNTLEEIWRGEPMQKLRADMLNETPHPACTRCYEQEESGFFSGRKSANKHHGHHIKKLEENPFEMTYWDIRFSNLCNLKCRSCGHIFSSNWYQDQKKLVQNHFLQAYASIADPSWPPVTTAEDFESLPDYIKDECINVHGVFPPSNIQPLSYAGRTEMDMWEQLEPHLDYVEQIYFAGGEPLLMEEHYRILDELVKRGRTDVRLIYNTNFTHTNLKGQSVFEYWKQFKTVAVGASLDASGARGEYIRKGTDWEVVEQNRRDMLRICPQVDFYISPTLSIMNAMHLPDFHRDWVEKGLLKPQDLNVNILQDPVYYRIDIATAEYKQQIKHKFEQHIEWLRPQDQLGRATVGFESAVNFMMQTDNTHLLDTFWRKTYELDSIRNENIMNIIPELRALR
jgi:organic radical activating enzyme